ncbi:hypothetical protein PC9H_004369 [Pleurotus ostreatus]|uniref:Uncharacterized protein n=1 Tax=Pleurotus ostreatus TaxID=5322 RepID=A0A8H7DW54_PLEOS|nr:uncharacterized protein PC9H_004369 [Pleurotus ostreatus]KAF7437527.1 hypothetical protein PC9H_004369 [Pleurotus ostreatus]
MNEDGMGKRKRKPETAYAKRGQTKTRNEHTERRDRRRNAKQRTVYEIRDTRYECEDEDKDDDESGCLDVERAMWNVGSGAAGNGYGNDGPSGFDQSRALFTARNSRTHALALALVVARLVGPRARVWIPAAQTVPVVQSPAIRPRLALLGVLFVRRNRAITQLTGTTATAQLSSPQSTHALALTSLAGVLRALNLNLSPRFKASRRPSANNSRRRARRLRLRVLSIQSRVVDVDDNWRACYSDLVDLGVSWEAIGARNELKLWAVQAMAADARSSWNEAQARRRRTTNTQGHEDLLHPSKKTKVKAGRVTHECNDPNECIRVHSNSEVSTHPSTHGSERGNGDASTFELAGAARHKDVGRDDWARPSRNVQARRRECRTRKDQQGHKHLPHPLKKKK